MSQRDIWHKRIYWLTLFGVVIGLPLNKLVLSLSGMLMALNWLIEGDFKTKFSRLKNEKTGLLLSALFLFIALTLLYSNDFEYGLKDLRIKLPMLLFPLVILSSEAVSEKLYKWLIFAFVLSIFGVTLANYLFYCQSSKVYVDVREMSLFDSHIRLSLMVAIAAFLSGRAFFELRGILKIVALILTLWFLYYTHKSEVLTGYFSVVIAAFAVLIWYVFNKSKLPKLLLASSSILICSLIFYVLYLAVYPIPKEHLNKTDLPKFTALGNPYDHNLESKILENGYYIHYFVCADELDSIWQIKTGTSLLSNENQQLYPTLLRYMTSLGLRKDADGISKLSTEDIQNIQSGYPSVVYADGGLRARLARITMEIQKHLEGADPNGSTIQQRFEYWRTGLNIIKENIVLGVGAGDVQSAFNEQYDNQNSRLNPENRLHTHQQFLTIWIATGIFGLVLFLTYILLIIRLSVQLNSYTLLVVWSIITFSYFFEDTLETQVGVTLAAFLITFILKQEKKYPLFKAKI